MSFLFDGTGGILLTPEELRISRKMSIPGFLTNVSKNRLCVQGLTLPGFCISVIDFLAAPVPQIGSVRSLGGCGDAFTTPLSALVFGIERAVEKRIGIHPCGEAFQFTVGELDLLMAFQQLRHQ